MAAFDKDGNLVAQKKAKIYTTKHTGIEGVSIFVCFSGRLPLVVVQLRATKSYWPDFHGLFAIFSPK